MEVDSSMSPAVAAKKAKPSDQGSEDVSQSIFIASLWIWYLYEVYEIKDYAWLNCLFWLNYVLL